MYENFDFGLDSTALTIVDSNAVIPEVPVAAVPEAATWGMMILGFGAIGTSMRRRKSAVRTSVSFA